MFNATKLQNRPFSLARFVVALIACATAMAANGQDCDKALGYIRDMNASTGARESASHFKRFFCDQTFDSFGSASDTGLKLGIDLEDLPLSLEGHNRGRNWSEYQHSVCQSIQDDTWHSQSWNVAVMKANKGVVDAWTTCVTASGLHFWAELNDNDPTLVVLRAKYISNGPPYLTAANGPVSFEPADAMQASDCSADMIKKDTHIDSAGLIQNCHRRKHTALSIALSTRNGGWPIPIPKIENVTPNGHPERSACRFAEEVVAAAYRQVLERDPDPSGLVSWSASLLNGQNTVGTLVRSLGTSPEYHARFVDNRPAEEVVKLMYKHFLARDAE